MPNHCENHLYIRGLKTEVEKFINAVSTGETGEDAEKYTICDKLLPMPKAITEMGAKEELEWGLNNWGTKWGDYETMLEEELGDVLEDAKDGDAVTVCFYFLSAWGPPSLAITTISKSWLGLEFELRYREPGMGFEGIDRIEDGLNKQLYYSDDPLGRYACLV